MLRLTPNFSRRNRARTASPPIVAHTRTTVGKMKISPAVKQLQPVQKKADNGAKSPEKYGSQTCSGSTTPEKRVHCLSDSVRAFLHQDGGRESFSCQFKKGFSSFILFCIITCNNGVAQILSFLVCSFLEFQATCYPFTSTPGMFHSILETSQALCQAALSQKRFSYRFVLS